MIGEIGLHLSNDGCVMRSLFVQPEHSWITGCTGTVHGKLHPVLNRGIFCLAGTPDVPLLHGILEKNFSGGVGHADDSMTWDLEGLVVGAIFFSGLSHEADIGNGAHGLWIKGSMHFAEIDDCLVDTRVGTIGNNGKRILGLSGGIPHLPPGPDHGGHRGIHDDIAWHMKVGDPLFGVDHREGGTTLKSLLDIGLDGGFLIGG